MCQPSKILAASLRALGAALNFPGEPIDGVGMYALVHSLADKGERIDNSSIALKSPSISHTALKTLSLKPDAAGRSSTTSAIFPNLPFSKRVPL
jgi:hypothetical protein